MPAGKSGALLEVDLFAVLPVDGDVRVLWTTHSRLPEAAAGPLLGSASSPRNASVSPVSHERSPPAVTTTDMQVVDAAAGELLSDGAQRVGSPRYFEPVAGPSVRHARLTAPPEDIQLLSGPGVHSAFRALLFAIEFHPRSRFAPEQRRRGSSFDGKRRASSADFVKRGSSVGSALSQYDGSPVAGATQTPRLSVAGSSDASPASARFRPRQSVLVDASFGDGRKRHDPAVGLYAPADDPWSVRVEGVAPRDIAGTRWCVVPLALESERLPRTSSGLDPKKRSDGLPSWRIFSPTDSRPLVRRLASEEKPDPNQGRDDYWQMHALTAAVETNVQHREELIGALEAELKRLQEQLDSTSGERRQVMERHAALVQSMQPVLAQTEQRLASCLATVLTLPTASVGAAGEAPGREGLEMVQLAERPGTRQRHPASALKEELRSALSLLGAEKKHWRERYRGLRSAITATKDRKSRSSSRESPRGRTARPSVSHRFNVHRFSPPQRRGRDSAGSPDRASAPVRERTAALATRPEPKVRERTAALAIKREPKARAEARAEAREKREEKRVEEKPPTTRMRFSSRVQ